MSFILKLYAPFGSSSWWQVSVAFWLWKNVRKKRHLFRDFRILYPFKCIPKREKKQRGTTSNKDDFIMPVFKYIYQYFLNVLIIII